MRTFGQTQPVREQETDRESLEKALGKVFIITGYVKGESAKYKDGVARINGYDPQDPDKTVLKYRYTGKAIIHQMESMKKSVGMNGPDFNEEIKTTVVKVKNDKGEYLSLADPV